MMSLACHVTDCPSNEVAAVVVVLVAGSWRNDDVDEETKLESLNDHSNLIGYLRSEMHNYLYCIVLYCIVLYCIVLYCIVSYCIVLYCIVLNCIELYCIVLYCIVLYCTVLYCTALYCIVV